VLSLLPLMVTGAPSGSAQAEGQVGVGGVGDQDAGSLPAVQAENHIEEVQGIARGVGRHLVARPGGLVVGPFAGREPAAALHRASY
jgi:hypothetical protein